METRDGAGPGEPSGVAIEIQKGVFVIAAIKRPEPIAKRRVGPSNSRGLFHETTKSTSDESTAQYGNPTKRTRKNHFAGRPLPVFHAIDMGSGLFEETAEVLVFEEARIKVGVASAGIRDAAQDSPARTKSALDLSKSMK